MIEFKYIQDIFSVFCVPYVLKLTLDYILSFEDYALDEKI